MPFDALPTSSSASLAHRLQDVGIAPVSTATLNAHKAAQLRRHRAHPLGRSSTYLGAGAIVSAGLLAESLSARALNANAVINAIGLALSVMLTFYMLGGIISNTFDLRGKARWVERRWIGLHVPDTGPHAPEPIAEIVRDVVAFLPDAKVIYGELIQNRAVIDPYVVIRKGSDQACLGIWEGDQIIACAKYE